MDTFFSEERQDALKPFITDEEFFRLNPSASRRTRFWREADENRCRGGAGSQWECFWVVVAWPDGSISHRQFPFDGDPDRVWRRRWFAWFEKAYRRWLVDLSLHPEFR